MKGIFPKFQKMAPAGAAVCIATLVVAAGCQKSATGPVAPTVTAALTVAKPVAPVSRRATPAAVIPTVSIRTPIRDQPSFSLARVASGIKRGTAIAKFPKRFGGLCNASYARNAMLDWASGTRELGSWESEFGDIFFDVLRNGGVNVVGDPKDLFGQQTDAQSAEFLVGARIRKLDGKFCEKHRWLTGRPVGRFSGEFSIGVEWSIYSSLTKQTVARFETEGHFRLRKANGDGILVTFLGAYSDATEDLLRTRRFVDLVERKPSASDALARPLPREKTIPDETGEFAAIEIERMSASKLPIRRIIGGVTSAVVSVRAGSGHGSGFLIDRSGLLLTNEHVVRTTKRVQVVFGNGLEVTGTVVRRDPVHDVALIKILLRARSVLPMREKPARRPEDVYAVGSPMAEELAGTVTRGVVSAWRVSKPDGIRHIQAGVPISGGNSGGPLLDRFGNVVGISVGIIVGERAQNLNWFIPINVALDALNIVYRSTRVSGR